MREGNYHRRDGRHTEPPKKRRGGAALTIFAIVVFTFGLLGMIGLFGSAVSSFLQGAFGFVGYAFFALALLATVFRRMIRKRISARGMIFGALTSLVFLAWLQVLTSHAEFAALTEPVSFNAYVGACYEACLGTSGGVLIGWITYPLLAWIDKYAAIPLAVLFFVILFFALLPWMRGGAAAEKGARSVPTEPKTKKAKRAAKREEGELVLFVDKVRPGQRDARKVKLRGFFSRKAPSPEFFDLTDDRPLNSPEVLIPKPHVERYDAAQPHRDDRFDEEYDDYVPNHVPVVPREDVRTERRPYDDRLSASADLPPFIRRFREDLVETVDQPKPERESVPQVESPAPTVDRATLSASNPEPKVESRPRSIDYSDIITNVSDLERVRASAPKEPPREPFLGEVVSPVTKPVASAAPASPVQSVPVQNVPVQNVPATASAQSTPVVSEPTPAPAQVPHDASSATITPREASAMEPFETPTLAAKPDPVPPSRPIASPVTESDDSATEEPIRTRKPRSDIGGTHRSPDSPKPIGNYIPPNKVKQPDIEEVMREEAEAPARPYSPPPVTLLKEFPPIEDDENVEEMGEALVAALKSFNIDSRIVDYKIGPTFTQFAVTLPDNMSVNKLTPLEKDIKRKLKVNKKDIRIIPSVPDLDAVGVEVPNKVCATIGLRSIINSPVFEEKNKLMFAIGVDVSGNPVYGNLLKMPHLLVAGATGSGKSVCLNVIICSIMYHYSPEFVRFIMVDPKKVELSVYRDMPHMLIPSTITEPDKAISALSWLVEEMDRRYDLLMYSGCKDLESYNEKMEKTGGKKLYYIVFIIDEMADLMYAARKELDEKINRIAAKARAAGINLILATQRPSVDVITGTIKANLRAKIAFKVGSYVDSKTILDRGGAEGLFGYGDMLYMPADGGEPIRLQGPFLDKEIEPIVEYIKANNDCRFDNAAEKNIYASKEVAAPEPASGNEDADDGEDELFAQALDYFLESGQASISKLQIRFRIGYGRAARIVQTMVDRDYISKGEGGNKTRTVKITREEFEALYGNHDDDNTDGGDAQ